jgi:hypothetical protein
MTDRETKRLTELLEKKEQEEKAKTEFYKQVRKHRQEVLRELGVTDHPVRPSDNQTDKVLALVQRLLASYNMPDTIDNLEKLVVTCENRAKVHNDNM